jgi:hypothetical protein
LQIPEHHKQDHLITIFTFPSSLWHIASLGFTLQALSTSSPQSAFNPFMFTDGPTSEFWQVNATLVPQQADDWREVSALLRKLRGRRNKVRLYDPSRTLRGAGAVGPTINIETAAIAGATSIEVNGLIASQAVALAADDLIGIGENLFAVTDDAPSDAAGKATVSILAPLRQGVAFGDAVNLLYPTGLFQLVGGADAAVVVPGDIRQPITLQFVEDPDFD